MERPTFKAPLDFAATTVGANRTSGSPTLVVAAGSVFGSPSPSAPVRITVVKESTGDATHLICTGRTGNMLTVAVEPGFTDIALVVGDFAGVTASNAALADVHAAIVDLVDEVNSDSGGAVDSVAGKTGAVTLDTGDIGGLAAAISGKADSTTLATHTTNASNPHNVTKAQVGLGNADNTSDSAKPISTATATALAGKSNTGHGHVIGDVANLQTALDGKLATNGNGSALTGITSGQVGGLGTAATTNATAYATAAQGVKADSATQSADLSSGLATKANVSHNHVLSQITDFASGLASALASWVGSAAITTLGTITTGTWQAGKIVVAYLGSGSPAAGKYLDGGGSWTTLPSGGGATPGGGVGALQYNAGSGTLGGFGSWDGASLEVALGASGHIAITRSGADLFRVDEVGAVEFRGTQAFLGISDRTFGYTNYTGFYSIQSTANLFSGLLGNNVFSVSTVNGRLTVGITTYGYDGASAPAQVYVPNMDGSVPGTRVKGASGQSAPLADWVDSGNAVLSTVSANGYFTTRKNAAPADAELVAGEAAWWFDSTNGSAKLMVRAKQANGTVVSGSISLS